VCEGLIQMLEYKYVRRGICKVIGFAPLLPHSTRAATVKTTASAAVISPLLPPATATTVYVATVYSPLLPQTHRDASE